MSLMQKRNRFFGIFPEKTICSKNQVRIYIVVFMIQIIITTVWLFNFNYLCTNEQNSEKETQLQAFVTHNVFPYPEFSPRLYKGRFFSDQNRVDSMMDNNNNKNFAPCIVNSQKEDKEKGKYPDVESSTRPRCPEISPHLRGNIYTNTVVKYSFELLEQLFADLEYGGQYTPPDCLPRHTVAIIVPYRNRKYHLCFFLKHMHSFLRRQQVRYRIFVVESEPNSKFNKGLLFNAGYLEARKMTDFDCYIFHDVDLLPENDFNLYRCLNHSARHLSVAVDSLDNTLPCDCYNGGANAMTEEQIKLINGYSNKVYSLGLEDDLHNRIKTNNLSVSSEREDIARYKTLSYTHCKPNPSRWILLDPDKKGWKSDGLNSAKYNVLHIEKLKLCTYVLIDYDIQDPAFEEVANPDLQEFKNLEEENRAKTNPYILFYSVFCFALVIFVFAIIVLQL